MEYGGAFGFQHLPGVKIPFLQNSTITENLMKWSISDGLKIQAYSFAKPFKPFLTDEFVQDFFAAPMVTATLERMNSDRTFSPIGLPSDKIKFEQVKCTETTMRIFEKLQEEGRVVRKSGAIMKCVPEYFKPPEANRGDSNNLMEIEVCDLLRKLILWGDLDSAEDGDDDLTDALLKADRDEFLFKLFSHLALGGSLCQYEDMIMPYMDCTKTIYKELIGVTKDPNDESKLQVVSTVCRIFGVSNDLGYCGSKKGLERNLLFHKADYNNFLYLIVHPVKQICFTLYHHV